MTTKKQHRRPTGPYRTQYWPAVIEAAKRRRHLRKVAENYELTGHPACLNTIMVNADANLWLTYYTGRVTDPS